MEMKKKMKKGVGCKKGDAVSCPQAPVVLHPNKTHATNLVCVYLLKRFSCYKSRLRVFVKRFSCYKSRLRVFVKRFSCYKSRLRVFVKRFSCYKSRLRVFVKRFSCYKSRLRVFA